MSQADFSCAICYDLAAEPVVTRCGHLFCWNCLKQWLQREEFAEQICPVCRGRVDESIPGDIIPLYGKGSQKHPAADSSAQQQSQQQQRPQQSQQSQSQQERYQSQSRPRPAANRATPLPRPAGRYARHSLPLGIGSSFFFFSSNMATTIIIILVWAFYHFVPWRLWVARAEEAWNGTPTPQQQQQRQQQQREDLDQEGHQRSSVVVLPPPEVMVRNVILSVVVIYGLHSLLSVL